MNKTQPSAGQTDLLKFINRTDAKDIADSLTRVMWLSIFSTDEPVTAYEKQDLYLLKKIITYADQISKE